MKLMNLENCFKMAKEANAKYVGVCISTVGNEANEIIINPNVNFDKKLEYYKKAYNEDLVLKTYAGIKITGFTYGDTFDCIENQLV